jgi:hypothetical protein
MFTGGLGALFTVKTIGEIENTHWLAATITAAAAAGFLICAAAATLMLAGRGSLRASYGSAGTTFLPPPVTKWTALIAASLIVGPVLYMTYGSRVTDDLPALAGKDYGRLLVMVIGGVVLLIVIARRSLSGRRPVLTISADGIEFDDLSTRYTIDWDDITDIVGHLPKRRYFRPIVFERKSGPLLAINNASSYVPGGRALFWLIRFYWLHPAHRSELASGAAIDRLMTDRITVD